MQCLLNTFDSNTAILSLKLTACGNDYAVKLVTDLLAEPQILYIFRIKRLTLTVYIWVAYFWVTLAEKTYKSCQKSKSLLLSTGCTLLDIQFIRSTKSRLCTTLTICNITEILGLTNTQETQHKVQCVFN